MARHVTAAFLAIGVTFGLFYLMQALILSEGGAPSVDDFRCDRDVLHAGQLRSVHNRHE